MSGFLSTGSEEYTSRGDLDPGQDSDKVPGGRSFLLRVSSFAASFLGIVLLAMLALQIYFGSARVGVRYLRGERLIVGSPRVHVGVLAPASTVIVRTSIHNHTGVPVRLLGASTRCTCVMAIDLPAVIQPGSKFPLAFQVRALPGKTQVDEQVVIFTSDPRRPELSVVVTGSIRE